MTALLRTSAESEARILARIGIAVTVLMVTIAVLFSVVKPGSGQSAEVMSVTIDAPYVAQGVADDTPLIIHGVKVGQVTGLSSLATGGVRLQAQLQKAPTAGLTDSLGIDFRPANYFGVTGINLVPNPGGQPLQNGTRISLVPHGNFSLQALLSRFGDISEVFDQRLIDVIERVTRYGDALTPLLETMFTVGGTLANVQTVSTEQLLRNATGISVTLPGLTDSMLSLLHHWRMTYVAQGYNPDEELKDNPFVGTYDEAIMKTYNENRKMLLTQPDKWVLGALKEGLRAAETDLFSAVGKLESSHIYELFPAVDLIRTMADVVPKLVQPDDIADKLKEVRTRLERLYAGSGDQRALQVRIILDELPGVAAPLGLTLGATG